MICPALRIKLDVTRAVLSSWVVSLLISYNTPMILSQTFFLLPFHKRENWDCVPSTCPHGWFRCSPQFLTGDTASLSYLQLQLSDANCSPPPPELKFSIKIGQRNQWNFYCRILFLLFYVVGYFLCLITLDVIIGIGRGENEYRWNWCYPDILAFTWLYQLP